MRVALFVVSSASHEAIFDARSKDLKSCVLWSCCSSK